MDNGSTQETFAVKGFTPYAQIPKWILRSGNKLSHGAVRLYGAIMSYADNDSKSAFPGRDRLSVDIGSNTRSVSRFIKELEDFGALEVTRRRNKRTGNFYANHYVLVFNDPGAENGTRRDDEYDPITTPTVLNIDPPSSTTDTSARQKHPFTSDESDHQKDTCTTSQGQPATKAKAKPNPGNLTPNQRANLRQAMQHTAEKMKREKRSFWDDEVQELWWVFIGLVEDYFPDTYDSQFCDLLENGKWSISTKETSPLQAGIQLNKLINTALGL